MPRASRAARWTSKGMALPPSASGRMTYDSHSSSWIFRMSLWGTSGRDVGFGEGSFDAAGEVRGGGGACGRGGGGGRAGSACRL